MPIITRHSLLGDLSVVDLFLQREVTDKAVNMTRFPLTVAVHPAHCLRVVTWVPGGVEDDDAVRSDEVHPQAARSERNPANKWMEEAWTIKARADTRTL